MVCMGGEQARHEFSVYEALLSVERVLLSNPASPYGLAYLEHPDDLGRFGTQRK